MQFIHKATIFNQLFWLIREHFRPLVGQLDDTWRVFNQESLLKILLFAQITWKESLREIETWLQANEAKLYHLWLDSIARSTISYWNNKVNPDLYEQLFYCLYKQFKSSISKEIDLWITCIAMDSSLISLALSLFDRAKYRTTKWWVRIHVWLDVAECLPRFCVITDGKKWDNKIAKQIVSENRLYKWEMIIFDRYYVDFRLRKMIQDKEAFFVTRTKTNTNYVATEYFEKKWIGITYDARVELYWIDAQKKYPWELRVVRYYHKEDDREYEYITNNFDLDAEQIANIYKHRWSIETFFRWIKQNLKIKSFFGTSENAVKNQIRVAMIYYLLLRYLIESVKLWAKQALKLMRLISEKCLQWLWISELYVICKSKTSRCLWITSPPGIWLFS